MKRNVLIFMLCMICCLCFRNTLNAAPAYPLPIEVKLPDGSYITLRIYGDEFYHYTTTVDGYMVEQGKDGFYYYASESGWGERRISSVRAHNPSERGSQELLALGSKPKKTKPSFQALQRRQDKVAKMKRMCKTFSPLGNKKALILLVQFQDVKFSISNPHQAFDNLANQNGYSDNGGTGSIKDYYVDNSNGAFMPDFVVYGPITVSHDVAYYGTNNVVGDDQNAGEMVIEACYQAMMDGLDLKQFDTDNDGILDNVFIYYAGYNEAELADAYTIWPHRSSLGGEFVPSSDLRVADYACTSELRGNSGTNMCGIGTFCHEFAHVLGLMDAYDTDYMTNGEAGGLLSLSLMSSGNYNNNGKTPPCINAVEREMLGWLQFEELTTDGEYDLKPVSENKAYCIKTSNHGEYFVLESRDMNSKWDQYVLPNDKGEGLLIYHVDRSDNEILGVTAKERWAANSLNAVAEHPCFRFIPAHGDLNYTKETPGNYMFYPGVSSVVRSNFVSWDGKVLPARLENISIQGIGVHFNFYSTPIYAEKIEITPQEATISFLETKQLEVSIQPANVNDPTIVWESSEPTIAKVNENGLVTGVGIGVANITATSGDGKVSATCEITVTTDDMQVRELKMGQREILLTWVGVDKIKDWIIKWKKSGDSNFRMLESDTTFCIINQLSPNTSYDLQIIGKISGEETGVLISKTFETQALDGEFATILNIQQPFKEGDKFWPVVNNVQKNVRKIVWKLDGKIFPSTRNLVLPAGRHELRAEVTTDDGVTEILIRKITVEPKKK